MPPPGFVAPLVGRHFTLKEFTDVTRAVNRVSKIAGSAKRAEFFAMLGIELEFVDGFGPFLNEEDIEARPRVAENVYNAWKRKLRVIRVVAFSTEMLQHKFGLIKQDFAETKDMEFETFKALVEVAKDSCI